MLLTTIPIAYARYKRMKYWDRERWPNFSRQELACRCNGRFCDGDYVHDPDFLDCLQALRDTLGKPLHINSGHRCALWNAHVGGAPMSQHKRCAADISTHNHDRKSLFEAAKAVGFTGLGLARTFMHVDRRPKPCIWYYKGSYEIWQNL